MVWAPSQSKFWLRVCRRLKTFLECCFFGLRINSGKKCFNFPTWEKNCDCFKTKTLFFGLNINFIRISPPIKNPVYATACKLLLYCIIRDEDRDYAEKFDFKPSFTHNDSGDSCHTLICIYEMERYLKQQITHYIHYCML